MCFCFLGEKISFQICGLDVLTGCANAMTDHVNDK